MQYVLFPGHLFKKDTEEPYYISGYQLAKLYNVNYYECKVVFNSNYITKEFEIALYPKQDGDYKLPIKKRLNNHD